MSTNFTNLSGRPLDGGLARKLKRVLDLGFVREEVALGAAMPVRAATPIQISGTSTSSRSRQSMSMAIYFGEEKGRDDIDPGRKSKNEDCSYENADVTFMEISSSAFS